MDSLIFQPARENLLKYHDEREKVIRICRDINSYSKKLIFTFHRIPTSKELTPALMKQIRDILSVICNSLLQIHVDFWPSKNCSQFKLSISNSTEEMIEAFTFMYFVTSCELLSYEKFLLFVKWLIKVQMEDEQDREEMLDKAVADFLFGENDPIEDIHPDFIYLGDYFMGLFDLTGEIMRYTISNMVDPKTKAINRDNLKNLEFMEKLYSRTSELFNQYPDLNVEKGVFDVDYNYKGSGNMRKKMEVFKSSLEKVQGGVCDVLIRGEEASAEL